MRLPNYNEVQQSGGTRIPLPPAGGYVCKIVDVAVIRTTDKSDKLEVKIDIAEGEFTNCFVKFAEVYKKWKPAAIFRSSILKDNSVHPFLKSFLEAVKASNQNFNFNPDDFDERTLIGKLCGFTFGDAEWVFGGKTGISAKVKYPTTVDKIRAGDFKIPELEKAPEPKSAESAPKQSAGNDLELDDPPF